MVREVLSINVGQCGVQLGHKIWQQYLMEHAIDKYGIQLNTSHFHRDASFHCFFNETNDGRNLPRNIMIDLDPVCINREIKSSPFAAIYESQYMISGLEHAAHNFARGHYTLGKQIIDTFSNAIRLLVNECDNVQGFIINHSVSAGTGSGLGSLILERLAVDYRKKSKLGFEVYPSDDYNEKIVVAPYNALLTTHWLLDHTEISFVFDNRKLYQICNQISNIHLPSYDDLNSLISKVASSATASLRFEGELNVNLNEFQTNMPFPRLHFMIPSMAPIINKQTLIENKKILVHGFVRNTLNNTGSQYKAQKYVVVFV